MRWTLYRWVWQACAPLHIGYTPAGALNRTRLYIPARNMWAALTAEIARRQASNFPDYESVGQALQQYARFTYLYPAEFVNGKWYAWLPRYGQEEGRAGLYWYREESEIAPISDRAFRRRLLHTQPGTAIAAGTGAAEEGTLREVEYIATHWKPEQGQTPHRPTPVAFVGYLFLEEAPNDAKWQSILSELKEVRKLFIGGETRYGFGHLTLLSSSEEEPWEQAQACFGYEVDLQGDEPVVKNPQHLLGHGLLASQYAQGNREVVFQWNWQMPHTTNTLYWQPGTQVLKPDQDELVFAIDPNGFWAGRTEKRL